MALIKTTSDVLPAEMKGSGTPVGGNVLETTPTLTITWLAMIVTMPLASKQPNLSFACFAILTPLMISTKNISIVKTAPKSPSSSHIIAKIKSLSENGKKRYFWRELPSPTPNNPPAPIL